MKTLILTRITALVVGAAAAGVGCYASYEAAAKADGGYLMLAAPIVALAAALIPCLWERALHDRQWLRAAALFVVWLPCVSTVLYTAVERNHLAKAGGEAQRAALRMTVERAKTTVAEAKAAKVEATAKADKTRGLDAKACKNACQSARANEATAIGRLAEAETALAAAESKAVTEADFKQSPWLLPLALEGAGMILIAAGFNLGRAPIQVPVKVPTVAPAELAKRDRRIKRLEEELKKHRVREKARQTGPKLAVSH
jgi:uncharacterized membrane protein